VAPDGAQGGRPSLPDHGDQQETLGADREESPRADGVTEGHELVASRLDNGRAPSEVILGVQRERAGPILPAATVVMG
jgi:hypothetical protein